MPTGPVAGTRPSALGWLGQWRARGRQPLAGWLARRGPPTAGWRVDAGTHRLLAPGGSATGGGLADYQVDEAAEARDEAVDAERSERAVLGEVPGEEPDRQVRADEGKNAARDHLAADARAERPGEVGDLEHAGREDHWSGQQERVAHRVLAGYAAQHSGHRDDAVPADARQQRADLRRAEQHGLAEAHGRQPPVSGDRPGDLGITAGVNLPSVIVRDGRGLRRLIDCP